MPESENEYGQFGLSRRRFLIQVGKAGGAAALYETMTALGLINIPEAWAGVRSSCPKTLGKTNRLSYSVLGLAV